MTRATVILAALSTILLAGCSTIDGNFPSLAKRPIEGKVSMRAPDVLPDAAPAAPSTAQRSAIAAALGKVRAGEGAFRREISATAATIAGGRNAAPGSDSWANAQMAVSAVEAARSPSVEGLEAINRLRADAEASTGRHGLTAILDAHAQAEKIVSAQSEEIRRLAASLRTR